MYDALVRVPLVVAGLVGQRHGATDRALAQLTDVMPTLLDAVGLDIPDSVEGKSLVPHMCGAKAPLRPEAYCESPDGRQKMVRGRRYKLVESEDDALNAFYDLERDPYEFENLYGRPETAARQAELAGALDLFLTRAERRKAKE